MFVLYACVDLFFIIIIIIIIWVIQIETLKII